MALFLLTLLIWSGMELEWESQKVVPYASHVNPLVCFYISVQPLCLSNMKIPKITP